ncbi:MAG: formate dehydrogenase accessory sulfurtransferase FdhD [Candidatus Zhuqueibacterota bacterium]
MDNLLETVNIVKIVDGTRTEEVDLVVSEAPLTLFVNEQELVTLLCSPSHQQNMALGFLFSEGFITKKVEIKEIIENKNRGIVWVTLSRPFEIDDNFRKGRTVTTGCARGLTFHKIFDRWNGDYITSKFTVAAKIISDISADLKQNSTLYLQSGGAHSATLYYQDTLLFSREDIGRHNAVDKIIGECLMNDISGDDKILMTSGRVSSEILLKAARWKFPILISRTAPTSAAVKLSDELGMTLIGFARGKRMNVYTNHWRIN